MSLGYPMGGARPPHVDLASGALTQRSSPYRTFASKPTALGVIPMTTHGNESAIGPVSL